jgi:signal transduction histidine kinase
MTRRGWLFDIALAAVLVGLGQLEAWLGVNATHRQGPHWAEALVYALTAALLVLRRVRPLACLALITAVSLVEYALAGSPEGFGVMMPALVASYSVARWEQRRPAWWALPLVAVLWLGWSGLDPQNHTLRMHLTALAWLSPWVIAWLVGALVRSQAQNLEQRRAARAGRAAQAVAEERNRIARELHDVIGHSVSVMTVQASAVRRRLTADQAVERQALETVESVGREALAEMRRMVGVLRDSGAASDREPPPGLAQVERLVVEFRAAGLPATLEVSGEPRALAPGLDLTAYRLVQEGLTNALRHAVSPQHARVRIAYGTDNLELTVQDDGVLQHPGAEPGHGLLGMRERVGVYGGTLIARPRTDRGFELIACLPLEPA